MKIHFVSRKELHNIPLLFHSQFLTDNALPLIYRAYSLSTHNTDFLSREVGLQQATELDSLFIEKVSVLFFDSSIEAFVNVINRLEQVFPIEQGINGIWNGIARTRKRFIIRIRSLPIAKPWQHRTESNMITSIPRLTTIIPIAKIVC